MIHASVYGRLGKDAQAIETRTGKPMAAVSLAVDVTSRDSEATVWVRVVAFGKTAEVLSQHAKGEALAAAGRLELTRWTGDDGTERETWQLIADHVHSARTVRPSGNGSTQGARPGTRPRLTPAGGGPPAAGAPPFDDEIPF
jgi:single-stranded DNA-binding protein